MRASNLRAYARRDLARMTARATTYNLQSMTVKKLWNTKYLTLMHADSGRAVMRARSRRAYARRLLARTCILGHLRANHGRAASYRPTNHNLQSMTVKKLWSTKYLTLMRAD